MMLLQKELYVQNQNRRNLPIWLKLRRKNYSEAKHTCWGFQSVKKGGCSEQESLMITSEVVFQDCTLPKMQEAKNLKMKTTESLLRWMFCWTITWAAYPQKERRRECLHICF